MFVGLKVPDVASDLYKSTGHINRVAHSSNTSVNRDLETMWELEYSPYTLAESEERLQELHPNCHL